MSFLEHLEELRQRLIRSVLALFVGTGVCFYFADNIYGFLAKPAVSVMCRNSPCSAGEAARRPMVPREKPASLCEWTSSPSRNTSI